MNSTFSSERDLSECTSIPFFSSLLETQSLRVRMGLNTRTKEKVAMKIIEKEKIKREDLLDNLKKEVAIMMMINHPHIVRLIEVLASKTKIYLVLEYIDGGELWDKIREQGKITEDVMRRYFRQIIRAIEYCKCRNIAHRDLKPENILIEKNGTVKVSDFGLSSLYRDPNNMTQLMHTTCGTINYLSPEVIQNAGYDGHIADVWALGVILFFCCAGYLPFEDDNIAKLLEKIVAAQIEYPKNFSKSLKDLISNILNPNPKKRYTLESIKSHPWFLEKITEEELKGFKDDQEKINSTNLYPPIPLTAFDSYDISPINNGVNDTNLNSTFLKDNLLISQIEPLGPGKVLPLSLSDRGSFLVSNIPPQSTITMNGNTANANSSSLNPRKLDAFSLTFLLSGSLLNRVFDLNTLKPSKPAIEEKPRGQDEQSQMKDALKDIVMKNKKGLALYSQRLILDNLQFTSSNPITEIHDLIMKTFNAHQPTSVEKEDPTNCVKFKATFNVKKEKLVILCEVFDISFETYLIQYSKAEGDNNTFLKLYEKIFAELQVLTNKGENKPIKRLSLNGTESVSDFGASNAKKGEIKDVLTR
eukprot:TRINITY_DN4327_c0_g1_i11.p1 TRINITY_DN4327_c0_g1~~TRINITY_DN4327_c0_g1_i11.p1  ORF type:complete len:587 (-),score=117.16 TRINITY_DN4327_c0_g1_i11:267-2027(-)